MKQVVNHLEADKAPEPDGFTIKIFQKFWNLVKDDLLDGLNHTFITLVPKVAGADSMEQFRPISCVNSLYKIHAKILADRLAEVVPDLISGNQAAFVGG